MTISTKTFLSFVIFTFMPITFSSCTLLDDSSELSRRCEDNTSCETGHTCLSGICQYVSNVQIEIAGYYNDTNYKQCRENQSVLRMSLLFSQPNSHIFPGIDITKDDIYFTNSKIYPLDELANNITCSDPSQCPSFDFECKDLAPSDNDPSKVCIKTDVDIPLDPAQEVIFKSDSREKAIAIVMDYSGSLNGIDELGYDPAQRTDWRDIRISVALAFVAHMAEKAEKNYQEAYVSLFSFQKEGYFGVEQVVPFTQNRAALEEGIRSLGTSEDGKSPMFEAIEKAANGQGDVKGLRDQDDRERYMIVFTDGMSDGSTDSSLESAIEALTEDDSITFFIVHLDSNDVPDTQIGPNEEFKRMACEAGGYYYYTKEPKNLDKNFGTISKAIEGTWDITINIPGLHTLPPGLYAVETQIEVLSGLITQLFTYGYDENNGTYLDNRIMVRVVD